jgi:hypothetical protein
MAVTVTLTTQQADALMEILLNTEDFLRDVIRDDRYFPAPDITPPMWQQATASLEQAQAIRAAIVQAQNTSHGVD